MNKAELAEFDRSIKGMIPHNRAWILNRDVAKLIHEIRRLNDELAELKARAETVETIEKKES